MNSSNEHSYKNQHQHASLLDSQSEYLFDLSNRLHTAANDLTFAAYDLQDQSIVIRKRIYDESNRSRGAYQAPKPTTRSNTDERDIQDVVRSSYRAGLIIKSGTEALQLIQKILDHVKPEDSPEMLVEGVNPNAKRESNDMSDPIKFIMDMAAKIVARSMPEALQKNTDTVLQAACRIAQPSLITDVNKRARCHNPVDPVPELVSNNPDDELEKAEQESIPETTYDDQDSEIEDMVESPVTSPMIGENTKHIGDQRWRRFAFLD